MSRDQQIIRTLQNLPFYSMIGGPLSACIRAQAESAQTCIDFVQQVGMQTVEDKKTGKISEEVIYVHFNFVQGGRRINMSVPLLTIIPIPYICINTVDINFTAKVCGTESESDERLYESTNDRTSTSNHKSGWFGRHKTNIKTQFSSKRSSKGTSDSTYSVESTIDVAVHASQDSMPAGMAKVLEMLGNAIDTCNPDGELTVNDTLFYVNKNECATVIAMYKSPEGVFEPDMIQCSNVNDSNKRVNKNQGTLTLTLGKGIYTLTANELSVEVTVEEKA